MSQWFTPADAAEMALPGVPTVAANVRAMADREDWRRPEWANIRWRPRAGRGGGIEYHYSVLPPLARIEWALANGIQGEPDATPPVAEDKQAAAWRHYHRQTDKKKAEATRRLKALDTMAALMRDIGVPKCAAVSQVACAFGISPNTLRGWEAAVRGVDRQHWAAYLVPHHMGRTAVAEITDDAWEWLKGAYLRPEQPTLSSCYRDLVALAAARGWTVPSEDAIARKLERDVPATARILARRGVDTLKQLYPAQQRDRSHLRALEAVNADGHKIDVFVEWPGGDVIRPMLIVFQDLYSGKILSWRVDRSENYEAVRLAFGDLIEEFGVPEHCTLDNTRTFASKKLTGGMSNRFRFKVKPEDPAGILTTMGIKVHWSTPYSGQSKPIERAFRDFASNIAKHPAFAGAYVGNAVDAKPENYGSRAIKLDAFLAVVAERIAEHNARPGRRTAVCTGELSFDAAFEASYAAHPVRKCSEEQRRLWLLAADDVLVKRDGVLFHGNRYWGEFLASMRGRKVTLRFDPELLHEPIAVYRLDGSFIGHAECLEAAGFYDLQAAMEHGRRRRAWMKAQKSMLAAQRTMDAAQVAAMMPQVAEPPPMETKVVRLVHASSGRAAAQAARQAEEQEDFDDSFIEAVRAQRAERHLSLVGREEIDADD